MLLYQTSICTFWTSYFQWPDNHCKFSSIQTLCNEWLAIIEETKSNDIPTTFFYIQHCLQIFLQRSLETPKYVQLMKDLALCLGHEKLPSVEESELKTLMKTIQAIDIKEKVSFMNFYSL